NPDLLQFELKKFLLHCFYLCWITKSFRNPFWFFLREETSKKTCMKVLMRLPGNGYHTKDKKKAKNNQTKHGMEKTKSNRSQSQSKSTGKSTPKKSKVK
ncbi:hypothetical protein Tco_0275021, partial [Tanacetum coccineum]